MDTFWIYWNSVLSIDRYQRSALSEWDDQIPFRASIHSGRTSVVHNNIPSRLSKEGFCRHIERQGSSHAKLQAHQYFCFLTVSKPQAWHVVEQCLS